MQPGQAISYQSDRLDPIALAVMRIFGPDIFISYRKGEAADYARLLRHALERLGYKCFLDEDWQPPGYNIELYQSIARRSRMFVLIGSRTVLQSQHIPLELEAYSKAHAGWLSRRWHRVFPISVAGALAIFETAATCQEYRDTPWGALTGLVAESETQEALVGGRPSESIPQRIARTYGLLRGTRFLLLATVLLAMAILGVTLWTIRRSVGKAERQVQDAKAQLGRLTIQKDAADHDRDTAKAAADAARGAEAAARAQAEEETERARQQRVIADASSLLGRALRLPNAEWEGSLNIRRALLAAKSWKLYPSAAAMQAMSEILATLPRRLNSFQTAIGVLHLAVDPDGRLIAGSSKRELRVWDRMGTPQWAKSLDADVQHLVFAKERKELLIATDTGFLRVSIDDGHELQNFTSGPGSWPTFSRDGEWIAFDGGGNKGMVLMPTGDTASQTPIPGRQACFPNNDTIYVLRRTAEGKDEIVEHTFAGPTAGTFSDDVFTVPGPDSVALRECYFGAILSGTVAYPLHTLHTPKAIPVSADELFYNDYDGMLLAIRDLGMSQLLRDVGGYMEPDWRLNTFLPNATAAAFGPHGQVVIGDAEGNTVSIWDYSDQRQLANEAKTTDVLSATLAGLRNWHGLWSDILAAPDVKFLSPDGKWKCYAGEKQISIVNVAEGNVVLAVGYPNPQPFVQEFPRYLQAAFSVDGKSFALRDQVPRFWIWSLDPQGYYRSLCQAVSLLAYEKSGKDCPAEAPQVPQPFGP